MAKASKFTTKCNESINAEFVRGQQERVAETRMYEYERMVRDANGRIVHNRGDIVHQTKDSRGYWRDTDVLEARSKATVRQFAIGTIGNFVAGSELKGFATYGKEEPSTQRKVLKFADYVRVAVQSDEGGMQEMNLDSHVGRTFLRQLSRFLDLVEHCDSHPDILRPLAEAFHQDFRVCVYG